ATLLNEKEPASNGLLGWSGRPDLNWRPLRPERSALTKLSYAPIQAQRDYSPCHRELSTNPGTGGSRLFPFSGPYEGILWHIKLLSGKGVKFLEGLGKALAVSL